MGDGRREKGDGSDVFVAVVAVSVHVDVKVVCRGFSGHKRQRPLSATHFWASAGASVFNAFIAIAIGVVVVFLVVVFVVIDDMEESFEVKEALLFMCKRDGR